MIALFTTKPCKGEHQVRNRYHLPWFPKQPLLEGTDSDSSYALIESWISHCQKYHPSCREGNESIQKWLPTRLVDIGCPASKQAPRIIETTELLSDTQNTGKLEYLCLSHRWTSLMPVQLTSATIPMLREELPVSAVSQTFRDAFTVTRRLGFRYIWIDSLCIIQDSEQDWLTESSRMGSVYKHAVCTIAAVAAAEGSDKLFSIHDPTKGSPLTLQIVRKPPIDAWPCLGPRRWNFGPQTDVTGLYYCVSDNAWVKEVSRAALNRRGWVVQERLLSPRTISFSSELFWECRMMKASETVPIGFPSYEQTRHLPESPSSNVKIWRRISDFGPPRLTLFNDYQSWKLTVENFSRYDLTMERDKLPAISGIARELQGDEDPYLAGLWRNDLVSQLLWRRSSRNETREYYHLPVKYRGKHIRNYGTYNVLCLTSRVIAPSWSWASVNGPVHFPLPSHLISKNSKITAVIEECEVDLLTEDQFGQVSGGYLRLQGNVLTILTKDLDASENFFADSKETSPNVPFRWCIPLAQEYGLYTGLFCLVLTQLPTEDDKYKRVGVLHVRSQEEFDAMSWRQVYTERTITVV